MVASALSGDGFGIGVSTGAFAAAAAAAAAAGAGGSSNGSSRCPFPFLDERLYPRDGGYTGGRFCSSAATMTAQLGDGVACCLPCPVGEWVYSDGFLSRVDGVYKVAVLSLIGGLFLLLSWVVLPPERSHRHYLSVGLVCYVVLVSLAFVVPLHTNPSTCYDAITPGDMYSSTVCGVTGAFLQAGGIGAAVWVFLRAVWLHIRVFWDRDPGALFIWVALAAGILLPALLLGVTIAVSGFSYGLGKTCMLDRRNGFAVLWGWLIAFGIAAFVIQCVTTAYCVWVYWSAIGPRARRGGRGGKAVPGKYEDSNAAVDVEGGKVVAAGRGDQTLSLSKASVRFDERAVTKDSARQPWRHIRRMFALQWRSFTLSLLLVVESVYFSTVFWAQERKTEHAATDPAAAKWGECLVLSRGNKTACLPEAGALVLGEDYTIGSLLVAALVGVECFVLLVRGSIFVSWWDLITHPVLFAHERWRGDGTDEIPSAPPDKEDAPLPMYGRGMPAAEQVQATDHHTAAAKLQPHGSSIARGFSADEERAVGMQSIPPRPPRPNTASRKAAPNRDEESGNERVAGPSFIEAMRNGLLMNPVTTFVTRPLSKPPGGPATPSKKGRVGGDDRIPMLGLAKIEEETAGLDADGPSGMQRGIHKELPPRPIPTVPAKGIEKEDTIEHARRGSQALSSAVDTDDAQASNIRRRSSDQRSTESPIDPIGGRGKNPWDDEKAEDGGHVGMEL